MSTSTNNKHTVEVERNELQQRLDATSKALADRAKIGATLAYENIEARHAIEQLREALEDVLNMHRYEYGYTERHQKARRVLRETQSYSTGE